MFLNPKLLRIGWITMPVKPASKSTKKPAAKKTTVKDRTKIQPIWDLYRDGVTQGAINTFLSCREQFRLKTVFGYRNRAKAGTTAFGSAFHDILAATQHAHEGRQPKSLDNAIADYQHRLGELSPQAREETGVMLATIRCLIQQYGKRWEADHSRWKWLKREDTFNIGIPVADLGLTSFLKAAIAKPGVIPLRGRWDGVFQNPQTRLLETKTKSRIDEDGIAAMLAHDTQTQLYCWAIRKALGKEPAGVVYDVIRNPQLRQKQGESAIDFAKRIEADVCERPDWYFMRWDVTFTKGDLDRWETRFLRPVLRQMVEWWESIKDDPSDPWKSPLHFCNPGAFWNQYGRRDVFEAITSGNYFSLERRSEPYPELVD
jgi:hypothetical protein